MAARVAMSAVVQVFSGTGGASLPPNIPFPPAAGFGLGGGPLPGMPRFGGDAPMRLVGGTLRPLGLLIELGLATAAAIICAYGFFAVRTSSSKVADHQM
jgi:hypothetical protein